MEVFEYVEQGRGEPIVFLHGLFGGPENWAESIKHLNGEFRVLAPKFPLDGKRPGFDSIEKLTEYVKSFLDHKNLDRVSLCGNSLGGQVAIDFCLKYPQRAHKLVLTGSAGLFEQSLTGGELPKNTKEFIREKALEIFYDGRHVTDELVDRVHTMLLDRPTVRFLLKIAKSTRDYNVRNELMRIKVPTLIVWGADDKITPPSVAIEFQSLITDSKLIFIEQCGHSPPIERPQQFAELLRNFLKS